MSTPSSNYETDKRVDDYSDPLPDSQRDICHQLRDLIQPPTQR